MKTLELLAEQVKAAYQDWVTIPYIDSDSPIAIENNRSREIKWLVYQRLRDEYEQQVKFTPITDRIN